ncbi:hypothetical protein C8R47DRAFT_811461 [Mycena vitilis]|nr:hypothetical protein C8R47DRAFT_811461 [Mycena vitilis]
MGSLLRTWIALGLTQAVMEAYAACAGASQAQPLYRDWNPTLSDHFYTTDATEASTAGGYTPEGIRALLFTTQVVGSVQFYRLYNADAGDHFYTTNETEMHAAGYVVENKTPMYIYPTQLCGSVPFYRLFAGGTGDHFYTVDADERDGAEQSGWAYEWVAGYVFPPDTTGSTTTTSTTDKASTTTTPTITSPTSTTTTIAAVSHPPSSVASSAAASPSSTVPDVGTSDPVDVLPAPTSILDGASLADTQSSASASPSPSGSRAGTQIHASYLATPLAFGIFLHGWM